MHKKRQMNRLQKCTAVRHNSC